MDEFINVGIVIFVLIIANAIMIIINESIKRNMGEINHGNSKENSIEKVTP